MERTNLLGEEAILMGLKTSGVLLKQGSQSSVESRKIPFTITLKCEFRFNYKHENMNKIMLKIFRNKPLI